MTLVHLLVEGSRLLLRPQLQRSPLCSTMPLLPRQLGRGGITLLAPRIASTSLLAIAEHKRFITLKAGDVTDCAVLFLFVLSPSDLHVFLKLG